MKNRIVNTAILAVMVASAGYAKSIKDTLHSNNNTGNLTDGTLTASVVTPMKSESPVPDYTNTSDEVIITYRIQILALKEPIKVEKVSVNGLNADVYTEVNKGVTRYYLGEVHDLISAFDVRDEIKSNGFKDAVIVAFRNGQRITIKESLPLLGNN